MSANNQLVPTTPVGVPVLVSGPTRDEILRVLNLDQRKPEVMALVLTCDQDRFWSKVEVKDADSCWLWNAGFFSSGYGAFYLNGNNKHANRIAYELIFGELPDELVTDHLCRNRACCNPLHMEPVTNKENVLRGETIPAMNLAKTHCINGHLFNEENTHHGKQRTCRACNREKSNRHYHSKKVTA